MERTTSFSPEFSSKLGDISHPLIATLRQSIYPLWEKNMAWEKPIPTVNYGNPWSFVNTLNHIPSLSLNVCSSPSRCCLIPRPVHTKNLQVLIDAKNNASLRGYSMTIWGNEYHARWVGNIMEKRGKKNRASKLWNRCDRGKDIMEEGAFR